MRWNCPHCGVGLAISDEKVGAGWSFSRCYKCAGHALVRRAEINLIKVDKAPPGERVLLPEATEEPLMSQAAAENYARVLADPARPAPSRASLKATASPAAQPPQFRIPGNAEAAGDPPFIAPLPEIGAAAQPRALPIAMGMAGAIAIGSGIYLYAQGMSLWSKARRSIPIAAIESPDDAPAPATASAALSGPNLQMDKVQSSAMAPTRPLAVRPQAAGVKVYSGPGADFSAIGVMDPRKPYRVSEWNERWLKVDLDGRIGWVRNDLVRPVAQDQ